MKTTQHACAKLNLTLDLLGKREDGYHEVRMIMQSVSLHDDLELETGTGQPLKVRTNLSFLPNNEKNLAAAAAVRFMEDTGYDPGGVSIAIRKRIPVCAGMAGGSADAAAALRALNELAGNPCTAQELAAIGGKIGSDVPFCLTGGTALSCGRGELLTPLPPLPDCTIVLCKPAFAISTPELFALSDRMKLRRRPDTDGVIAALEQGDLEGVARRLYNVFEDVLPERMARTVNEIRSILIAQGALGACMSGTGPTVFGLFREEESARLALERLREDYRDTFLAHPVEQV